MTGHATASSKGFTDFTDEDVEKWAAESERGDTGGHLGPALAGRPISVEQQARPAARFRTTMR